MKLLRFSSSFTRTWLDASRSQWTWEECTRVSGTTSLKPGLKLQHVSASSLCLLKQYEDALGGAPFEECIAPDWSTFPGIDPLVASVFEWGHSMDDDT